MTTTKHDNWRIKRGSTVIWPIVVTDGAGSPKNLIGATVRYLLAPTAGTTPATVDVSSASNPTVVTITNAAQGQAQVRLVPATTGALPVGAAYHEFWVTDSSGDADLVAAGHGFIDDTLLA